MISMPVLAFLCVVISVAARASVGPRLSGETEQMPTAVLLRILASVVVGAASVCGVGVALALGGAESAVFHAANLVVAASLLLLVNALWTRAGVSALPASIRGWAFVYFIHFCLVVSTRIQLYPTSADSIVIYVLCAPVCLLSVLLFIRTENDREYSPLSIAVEQSLVYEEGKFSKAVSVTRFFSLARPEAPLLVGATCALLLTTVIQLIIPTVMGAIISTLSDEDGEKSDLNQVTLVLVFLFMIQGCAGFFRAFLFHLCGERIVARVRTTLFNNVISQDIAFFDVNRSGEIVDRITADIASMQSAISMHLSFALRDVIQIFGGFVILFVLSWKLTLVMIAAVPVIALAVVRYAIFLRNSSKKVQDKLAESTAVAAEDLGNIRTIRSFANEKYEENRYAKKISETFDEAKKLAIAYGMFNGGAIFAANMTMALVMWYGGTLVIDGELDVGLLTAFILYTLFTAIALGSLSALFSDIMKAVGCSHRVFELMDRKPDMKNCTGGGEIPETVTEGEIEFKDVVFAYPSRKDSVVLKGMNLTLPKGKVVALVGTSGGGKSTVAALIQRFYDPLSGQILLDGRPIDKVDANWLRNQMATVSQEPVLFAASIKENILYGKKDATDAEIMEAARIANADTFIQQFSEKYDTLVGERGVRLSGGQKQRIAIARALLKDPKILILDEATSALDSESEYLVQQALERLMKGRTVLVIAHRLSTVKDAHRVAVVDGGVVAEIGTHSDLVERNGLYKQLVSRQLAHQND
eukprot:TRINITY_DN5288_c0_g1_i1.p1 TRINITY_DN5288_c0_g1~~TRINITY_DN5288_c0_g1_i1.p1  ORF type:complete len:778 (+),score=241.01 TRINITY_DN5288_c0_g1_i1:66-2336(+)